MFSVAILPARFAISPLKDDTFLPPLIFKATRIGVERTKMGIPSHNQTSRGNP
jgi:hypothetical protein